jgi:methionine sulfoxide reductase heme-binding subunit
MFGGSTLWYLSRATGVVSVVLLTVVVVLGVVTAGRRRPDGSSATVAMGVHRWLSMGMLAFLLTHIVTAIVDGYVDISWLSIVVPFISVYQPLLVGFGALAVDLLVAILVTSYLRHRIAERSWRFVHWATYGMWVIAVIHGFSFGTADQPVLRLITLGCGVVGGLFASWRVATSFADRSRRSEVAAQEWS